jgi:hypothetical protein
MEHDADPAYDERLLVELRAALTRLPRAPTLEEWTAAVLRLALEQTDWSLRAAARSLNVIPSRLQHLLSRRPKIDVERGWRGPPPGMRMDLVKKRSTT